MEPLSDDSIRAIFEGCECIAVVGASSDETKASHKVAAYLKSKGYRIIPVNPRETTILDEPAYKSLSDVAVVPDVVEVFRPADEAPDIARQAVAAGARTLWLQEGIISEEAAQIASRAGLQVVMDMCMKVMHERLMLGSPPAA